MQRTGDNGESYTIKSNDGFFGDTEVNQGQITRKLSKPQSNYKGGRLHRSTQDYQFIAFDGEGVTFDVPMTHSHGIYSEQGEVFFDYTPQPQPYVLLANSKGGRIISEQGLRTTLILDYLLQTKQQYPRSIFVGFSINYDINQWLKDVPEDYLWILHDTNKVRIGNYFIKWLPRKMFTVRHGHQTCTIYDVFGYFQSSFLDACRKYLGKDDPDLSIIERGKDARDLFTFSEMDDFIIPYNDTELKMLVKMMNILRDDFHGANIFPGQWYGPGAVANMVLKKRNIESCMNKKLPEEILDASQTAYAGGRFEHFGLGRHQGTVYEYDIHSAYPAAATHLPDLSGGTWETVESYEPGSFGVYYIDYLSPRGYGDNRPQPLFCRSHDGRISYPRQVQGWYWSPEAALCADYVRYGYVYRPWTTQRPFSFIKEMYDQRRLLKFQGSSTERALKLILNSIYGKLAQQIGGKNGPPVWHQLEWAGYITSYTRAKIYEAILKDPEAIIAAETDAVFSIRPLDLPLTDELGDWEKKEFKEIVYLQSGFYYATEEDDKVICRYRGMDRDRKTQQPVGLPYREVLDHLREYSGAEPLKRPKLTARRLSDPIATPPLSGHTTRFVGLGIGLQTNAVWRSWEKKPHILSLDNDSWFGKRFHLIDTCPACQDGKTLNDCLHPMQIGGYYGESYPTPLPWREVERVAQDYSEYINLEEWDQWS